MTWVHTDIYAAGGAHIPDTWDHFANQTGIRSIVHLNPGHPIPFQGGSPEAFLWLSVDREEEVDLATRMMTAQFVDHCLRSGHKVLIHSGRGRHRTRWIFVAWSILQGRSVAATLRTAAQAPWLDPYPTDEGVWEDFRRGVRQLS